MSIRRTALTAFLNITDNGAYSNLCLKQATEGLSPADARWVSAAVYTALDHLLLIDHILSAYIKGRQKPVIRGILRMGAAQMLFMRVGAAAACNESVKLAQEVGKGALSGYINGVMRALARDLDHLPELPKDTPKRLSIQYSWPLWLVEEWIERFGESEAEQLLTAGPQGMAIRAQYPFDDESLRRELDQRGVAYTRGKFDPNCFHLDQGIAIAEDRLFKNGQITVQSESAMLVCRACGVEQGWRVLDACAAPGGKSAYLSALAKGNLDLHAWELHAHRKALLDATLSRMHVRAHTRVLDATARHEEYDGHFDLVLLDVPCSGLGVAAEKPDIRYRQTPDAIGELVAIQGELLRTCAKYVRPGGILVYASCTISKRENEEQIERFLKENPRYHLKDLTPFLPDALPGLQNGMVQLLPHRDGIEGFFIARMRREV